MSFPQRLRSYRREVGQGRGLLVLVVRLERGRKICPGRFVAFGGRRDWQLRRLLARRWMLENISVLAYLEIIVQSRHNRVPRNKYIRGPYTPLPLTWCIGLSRFLLPTA